MALQDLPMSTENSNGPLRLLRDSGDETTPSFFLLSGFSFKNIHNSQNSRGRAGYFFSPLYHFHPLLRPLDIGAAITAETPPMHIVSSRTQPSNLWFPSATS